MKHLAIIPARGGSKRIPSKNIKKLNGKPLIVHTVDFALQSNFFDRVIVSTDSEEIANIALKAGAEVPFMRPTELAQDHVTDKPVISHCVNWIEKNENDLPDLIWYLKPTSPLRFKTDLLKIEKQFIRSKPDSIRSVTKVQSTDHPYWMFVKDEQGFSEPLIKGIHIKDYYQSQLLPPVYQLNGNYEVISIGTLKNHDFLFGEKISLYETAQDSSLDIDTPEDFNKAENYFNHD